MSTQRTDRPPPLTQSEAPRAAKRGPTATTTAKSKSGYFHTRDAKAAYKHFRPLALRVPTAGLAPFRADADVAAGNVDRGVAAVQPLLGTLAERCPTIDADELRELPALAQALVFAVGRVPASDVSPREIEAKLREVSRPRAMTLAFLEVAAEMGLVPETRVRAIREGKGKLDTAKDCVQIVGLFEEYADALAGKHPFDAEFLRTLAENGAWLTAALKPGRLTKTAEARSPEAIERDQFAKLLADRHDALRLAGANLFGLRDLDDKVPPLHSATRTVAVAESGADAGKDGGDQNPTG